MSLMSTKISLYIHIPFCSKKCNYCDFYSVTSSLDRSEEFVDELIHEMNYWLKKLDNPEVKTIFIGGGTPSLLPVTPLKKLLSHLQQECREVEEWSIESNPESITREFLETCSTYGVNRLSIGVQSFKNEILDIIGREAKESDIRRALKLVESNWDDDLNIDLISSLPGQTVSDITDDIEQVLKFNPDHISFYGLTIEEGTELEDQISKGEVEELDEEMSEEIWLKGNQLLKKHGYNNYEISNFTKSSPCQHNLNYWELKPYLGIGPSAVSTLPLNNNIIRKRNPSSLTTYLKGESLLWGEEIEDIEGEDFLSDYVMMGLRLKKGVDLIRFTQIFSLDLTVISVTIEEFIKKDILKVENHYLMFSPKSFPVMNHYLPDILDSLKHTKLKSINWFY